MTLALEYAQRYVNVARVWMGSNLIVFLTNPDDVEVILNSQEHIDKSSEYRFFKPWLGEGLLISTG
jgi:cytochrome P450 family 4